MHIFLLQLKRGVEWGGDFPCGPVFKNPFFPMQKDVGLNPGWRTKIPYATRQLSLHATTREEAHVLQVRPDAAK